MALVQAVADPAQQDDARSRGNRGGERAPNTTSEGFVLQACYAAPADVPRCSDERADHIARHGVEVQEVEEVFTEHVTYQVAGRGGSTVAYGRTAAGRLLMVVVAHDEAGLFVVTARAMTDPERRMYLRKVGAS